MKLILIDDDPIVSSSLKTILEMNDDISVLAIGTDGSDALPLYIQHSPDVVLMDIRMREKNGIDAGKDIIQHDGNARILYLTTFSDDEYIDSALELGAMGYVLKQDFENIVVALNSVMANQLVFGQVALDRLRKHTQPSELDHDFSDREVSLMRLVADGLNNREIADKLGYSEGTVRNQISTLLEKLALRDRTQLAIFYLKKVQK